MSTFKNKVVWITGASSGIGEALAYVFAKEKAILVLTARNKVQLAKVKVVCLKHTSHCILAPFDLTNVSELDQLVDQVIQQTGRIDVLINNAGQSQRSLAKDTPLSNDRHIMELNFFSPIALTKLVLPYMLQHGSGHFVAISSIKGKVGFPMRTSYSAAKHAIQGYFNSLRAELNDDNIHVSIISPSRIKTNVSLNALIENGKKYNKMDEGLANGMAPDKCAKLIVQAIEAKKTEALVGEIE